MPELRNIPIQRKLRFVILASCTAALCVASSALFALQYYFFHRDYRRDLVSVAQMIENLSGPIISLGQPEETVIFLTALEAKPHIVGAFIRTNDGRLAAQHGRVPDLRQDPELMTDGFHLYEGEQVYVRPIRDDGQRVGTLVLMSDYRVTSIKLQGVYACILIGVLALSFLVAVMISARLERVICGPIQALADTARRVASRADYTVRAEKQGNDEVGEFVDTFNGMLAQIEQRESALQREIAERRRTERELQQVHAQLMDASHQAGMAEVATGVLHNVGNVLNSVNVSANLIAEKIGDKRTENLVLAAQLLHQPNEPLEQFLTQNPKGKVLPAYLSKASEQVAQDRRDALMELELLTRNIDHIKDIVAMQQTYARVSGIVESLSVEDLICDATNMNADGFARHGIEIIHQFDRVPLVAVDKHKVLQILVNLMRNAKDAISESNSLEKRLVVRLRQKDAETLAIDLIDSGTGIAPENLTRIFSHGFTTRRDGHGFGLHSAALAAQQMNGSLVAHSAGIGHGATFTLELPVAPPTLRPEERPLAETTAHA